MSQIPPVSGILSSKTGSKTALNTKPITKQPPLFNKVVVVGLGLIGASLAQAIKDHDLSTQIAAVDQHLPSIKAALSEGLLTQGSNHLAEVVTGADLILIAVPVKAVKAVLSDIYQAMHSGVLTADCLISDVCSTNVTVIEAAKEVFGENIPSGLVPAHPIAGAENSGYYARRADLFGTATRSV